EEGYTFNLFFYSLGLIVFGIILSFLNIYIGSLIIVIGILLFFDKTGTYIDTPKERIGRYSSLFGWTTYRWTSIKKFDSAELDFEFISQKINSRGTSTTSRTKTYALTLIGENQKKLFHEYSNYEIAKKVLKALKDNFNFETLDKYYDTQKSAFQRRANRK
ncbi:hypothetical protein N9Q47_05255, partial [Vicingaceae bacterium]|nr:hypothetical protein [Vicingaceae bacterium]